MLNRHQNLSFSQSNKERNRYTTTRPLLVIFAFLIITITFLNFIIPPFQNPDEPQHFGGIMVEAWGEENQAEVEQAIIKMMDKHQWWRLVGMGRPAKLPERLVDISFLMGYYPLQDFKQRLAGIKFYHLILGRFFRFLRVRNINFAYYLCRLISIFLTLGGVIFLFLSLKIFKEELRQFFWLAFLFILFLPQFLISSLGVNSDALANFLGGAFFWAMALLMAGRGRREVLYPLFVGTAVLGFLVDRSTFLLVPLSLVGPFFLVKKERYQESIVDILMLVIIFLFLAITFVNLFPLLAENNFMWFSRVIKRFSEAGPVFLSLGKEARDFLVFIADSFLVKFGWAVFGVGAVVYYVWRVIIMVVMVGVVVYLGRAMGLVWMRGWVRLKEIYGLKTRRRFRRRTVSEFGRGTFDWKKEGWQLRDIIRDKREKLGEGRRGGSESVEVGKRGIEIGQSEQMGRGAFLKFAIFSVIAIILQLLGAWSFYGTRMLAQGRHFFPLIIPIAFLFALGMKEFIKIIALSERVKQMVVVGFIVFEFVLLNYVIWAKLIPIFHLTISSPHPGV